MKRRDRAGQFSIEKEFPTIHFIGNAPCSRASVSNTIVEDDPWRQLDLEQAGAALDR